MFNDGTSKLDLELYSVRTVNYDGSQKQEEDMKNASLISLHTRK
jgi:hypothetical protein